MPAFLLTEEQVRHALQQVIDPELGVNIVDLGLIYGITIEGCTVTITMTLTTPGCPLHESLAHAVEEAVRLFIPGVEAVRVQLVWEPPWTPDRISPAGRAELGWE